MKKKSGLRELIEGLIKPRRVTAGNPYHKGAGPGGGQFASKPGSAESRIMTGFNALSPQQKLNPNLYGSVVYGMLKGESGKLLSKMEKHPGEAEHRAYVWQNEHTGELVVKRQIGTEWGKVGREAEPAGFRLVGDIHTHPKAGTTKPSERDLFTVNNISRSGGVYMIAGYENGKRKTRYWHVDKGADMEAKGDYYRHGGTLL